jgi:hypothetical protein
MRWSKAPAGVVVRRKSATVSGDHVIVVRGDGSLDMHQPGLLFPTLRAWC